MSVEVEPSIQGPVRIGTVVNLYASVADVSDGPLMYRFRIRQPNTPEFRTVRDFSPESSFSWVPTGVEGNYEIEVSVHNGDDGETVDRTTSYRVDSHVVGDSPTISPTNNKLVFLYSAPPCAQGSRMRVRFVAPDGFRQFTPVMRCNGLTSMNTYLGGLRQDTQYTVQQTISDADGNPTPGPVLTLKTERLDFTVPVTRTLQKPVGTQGVLLQSNPFSRNVATDLDGNIIWYSAADIRYLTTPEPGGYFVALYDNWGYDDSAQILRVLDMAGNVVAETNAARINQQLADRGMLPITSFHHDARFIEGGRILVLAGNERLLSDVQGPDEVDIIGDAILVLNSDLQVEWAWDAFDHLDVRRAALLGETCTFGSGGCPVFRLAAVANDWLHGNAVQLTPDGNILYSARHQDWLIKIDYAHGTGSGDVLWRLGQDGDFRIIADTPLPWFSHQHDPNFERDTPNRLILFDNGNTRWPENHDAHSRGQVLQIDEEARTATLVFNADLGDYSRALGSAEKLENGNYHFGLGWDSNNFSQSLEYDPSGNLITQIQVETQMYRSYRMRDLYTPPR